MRLTQTGHSRELHAVGQLWYDKAMPRPAAPDSLDKRLLVSELDARSEQSTLSSSSTVTHAVHELFVGRKSEVTTLQTALAHALASRGQLVLVSGEPGIGKTRLAQEFADSARQQGAAVLWGRCWEGDGAPAFWPWVQIIRTLVQQCDADSLAKDMGRGAAHIAHVVPEVCEQLPHVSTTTGMDSEHARFRFFDSLTSWLKRAAKQQPLLLILDDLHWADVSSLLLLQFLARELADARLFVLGTYRDTEVSSGHPLAETLGTLARMSQRLALGGLTEAEVADFVVGTGLYSGEALVTTLCKETEGNPFCLTEVIHLLAREEKPTVTPFPIPHGVQETIRRRLARLSPACGQLLTTAAVIGREFTLDVLAHSTNVHTESARLQMLTLIQEALTARLLVDAVDKGHTYRFVHALVRETLYEDLPLPQRIACHRQVGEAIEQLYAVDLGPYRAELADHFFKATAGERNEKALQYTIQAAERANTLLAYEEAATYYERAFHLLPQYEASIHQRGEILLAMGHALARAGELKRARATFSQAAVTARDLLAHGETTTAALLLTRAALGFSGHGDIATRFDQAMVSLLEEALAALPEEDSALRVRVLSRLAMALYFSPFMDRCDALSREAVEMARRLGDTTALAYALNARQIALIGPDTVQERLALSTEIIHLAEQESRQELALAGRLGRIMSLLELGDPQAIEQELHLYVAIATELRQPFYLWHGTILRAMAALLAGQLAEAEQLVQHGLTLGQQIQTPNAFLLFTVQLFALRREQGRVQELEDASRGLVERFPAIPGLRTGLAFLYSEIGREKEAREEFEHVAAQDFTDIVRDQGWLGSMTNLAQVAFFLHDKKRASTLYNMLLPYAERNVIVGSANDCFGAVARYLGLLAATLERWDEATHHFEKAIALNRRVGARLFTAHTQCDYAALLITQGNPNDVGRARELLDTALSTAQELGMTRLEGKIQGLGMKDWERGKEVPPPQVSHLQPAAFKSQPSDTEQRPLEVPSPTPPPSSRTPNFLRPEGDSWAVSYEGTAVRLQDTKGLAHLACLLREPQREFHVFDLLAMTDGMPTDSLGTRKHEAQILELSSSSEFPSDAASPDQQARTMYQQRLQDLREELDTAERLNDLGRVNSLQSEIDFLTGEFAAAYGTGTYARKRNSDTEKVRKTITHRIRTMMSKIKKAHPSLWRHLHVSLKTGTYCSYNPEKPTEWDV